MAEASRRATAAEQDEGVVIRAPVDVRNVALSTVAALAFVLFLHYAESVLVPIILGVLISYALTPLVAGLVKLRAPRALAAALAVLLLLGAIGTGAYTLSDEAMSIVANLPEAARRLRQRVVAHQRDDETALLAQVKKAANEIEKTAAAATETDAPSPNRVQRVEVVQPAFRASDYLWIGGVGLVGFIGQFAMIIFLVFFMLAAGDLFKRKLAKIAGPTLSKRRVTVQILEEINAQIEGYIKVQLLTNTIVAIATGAALWWFGVENFAMWGLLAGLFNSIPYLGPVIVTIGLGTVSFMQFDDLLKSAYVCAVAFAITSLEGFVLTPTLVSRAAQMNPVAIFVGLLFWTWIWGVWGTVLAVPMLMIAKAICDRVEDLQAVGELLGE